MKKQRKRRVPAVFTRKMSEKTMVYFVILLLMLFGLSIVILKINETKGDEYTVKVLAQQNYNSKVLPFKRGDITDRNGVMLATSIKVYNLILDPKLILEKEAFLEPTLEALNQCFGYDIETLKQLIQDNKDRSYLVYQKQLSYEQIKDFLDISNNTEDHPNVKGVTFESEYQRKYPFSTLASQVIGFTASGNVGIGGIEQQYDEYLDGVDGREYGYVNSDNIMEKITKNAEDGDNIITTIDFNIQTIVEKYLAEWKEKYTPDNIAAIVMDPNTGEILAMAGKVNYDLNNPSDLTAFYPQEQIDVMSEDDKLNALNEIWRNFCVSDTYELGSTFKPFTVAIALELGLINEDSMFVCDGGEQYAEYIKCHKREGHGTISAADGLAFSCNDVMMQLSALEGKDLFCNYQRRYGFGSKTGIDLPGEASCDGLLFNPSTMIDQDLAVSSFGQCWNSTMIQLATGFCSLINGGYYYQPHVMKQIVKGNGTIVQEADVQPVKQTVTKGTSDYIKKGLRACVDYGTGRSAALNGYLASGKTGTAQQMNISADHYLLSFIGFAPYDHPEVVCYVLMDNPSEDSSSVTGSLFAAIMNEVLPYLNVAKDGTVTDTTAEQPQEGQTTDPAAEQPQEGQTTDPAAEQPQEPETTVSNIGMEEYAQTNIEGQTSASGE
ncbi:MAG: penicillin-binding protein 2 [Lachnospiraceae bacterium]|nr:penicillin-binding protein 2 [Lachnospiraceae bacterium]